MGAGALLAVIADSICQFKLWIFVLLFFFCCTDSMKSLQFLIDHFVSKIQIPWQNKNVDTYQIECINFVCSFRCCWLQWGGFSLDFMQIPGVILSFPVVIFSLDQTIANNEITSFDMEQILYQLRDDWTIRPLTLTVHFTRYIFVGVLKKRMKNTNISILPVHYTHTVRR